MSDDAKHDDDEHPAEKPAAAKVEAPKKATKPAPVDADDEDDDEDEDDEEEAAAKAAAADDADDEPESAPKKKKKKKKKKPPPPTSVWPIAVAIVIVGLGAAYLIAQRGKANGNERADVPALPDKLPPGLSQKDLPSAEPQQWSDKGYTQLTPPIRLPARADGQGEIQVWVKLPRGGKISAKELPAQKRSTIVWPAGTIADRLEVHGTPPRIVDIRGTEIGAGQEETFHVYRKEADGLRGYYWKRGDDVVQAAADRFVVGHARLNEKSRDKFKLLRVNNACAPCHSHDRAQKIAAADLKGPSRGTDANGFFLPEYVLRDAAPVEHHRDREMNMDDKFITWQCTDAAGKQTAATVETRKGGLKWPTCGEGGVLPIATLDVKSALAAGDAHAKKVCASRKFLFDNMDDVARKAFAESFSTCGIGQADGRAAPVDH